MRPYSLDRISAHAAQGSVASSGPPSFGLFAWCSRLLSTLYITFVPIPGFSIDNQGWRVLAQCARPVSLSAGARASARTLTAYSRLQKGGDPAAGSPTATLLRLRPSHRARLRRLPPLRVGSPTSGAPDSHGVTGGVYKARERIHRGVADPRLLAIPASCSRVTDCNPNLDQVFAIRSASRPRCALSWPL